MQAFVIGVIRIWFKNEKMTVVLEKQWALVR
jgi:hypothetical protein